MRNERNDNESDCATFIISLKYLELKCSQTLYKGIELATQTTRNTLFAFLTHINARKSRAHYRVCEYRYSPNGTL